MSQNLFGAVSESINTKKNVKKLKINIIYLCFCERKRENTAKKGIKNVCKTIKSKNNNIDTPYNQPSKAKK